ncbi:hypothetical protein Pmar_PMAR009992 [Perkinsus marinus ATCC 50983]|uniref:Uncharacterized protein n=1 Tax=Perkinsus marinus (strain ATCC 50983 / TXsc) TaxID=423536 RepID=C5L2T5_PERM5|nr:hypothetical protein Pmar_PMAR009992 [Perkinsus marinus ATCC 50983]EER09000.1 hypothetical protein Pmar_PMAR009992 [Perkinsus marinus ATCC 50983]|eukprot:XP_002777184.1 hypothetical protein Pmar_PMAR009992 [Perkinsus marinus ATCC 50983]
MTEATAKDFRPISVTCLFARLAESMVVYRAESQLERDDATGNETGELDNDELHPKQSTLMTNGYQLKMRHGYLALYLIRLSAGGVTSKNYGRAAIEWPSNQSLGVENGPPPVLPFD